MVEGPLPNVRGVSVQIHQEYSSLSTQYTDLFMSWAQFLAHDLTRQGFLRGKRKKRIIRYVLNNNNNNKKSHILYKLCFRIYGYNYIIDNLRSVVVTVCRLFKCREIRSVN